MNKIFYNANTQYGNTGDLLIHKSLLQSLSDYGEVIIEDKTIPEWYLSRLKLPHCKRLSAYTSSSLTAFILKTCLTKKKGTKVYYVDGLGHKMSKGRKRAMHTLKAFIKYMTLKLFGCKILRFAVTLGPYDKANAIAEAIISRAFYFYSVRDKESQELAQKLNFKPTAYFPDLAWSYQLQKELIARQPVRSGNYIVLSFRSNSIGVVSDTKYLDYILSQLKLLLDNPKLDQYKLVVLYQVEYDKKASEYISKQLSGRHNVELINERLFIEEAAAVYQNAAFIISNRLHVLLLGAIAGSLPIAFLKTAKHTKVVNIFKVNNLLDLVIDTNESKEDLDKKLNQILDNRSFYLELVSKSIDINTQQTNELLKDLFAGN